VKEICSGVDLYVRGPAKKGQGKKHKKETVSETISRGETIRATSTAKKESAGTGVMGPEGGHVSSQILHGTGGGSTAEWLLKVENTRKRTGRKQGEAGETILLY